MVRHKKQLYSKEIIKTLNWLESKPKSGKFSKGPSVISGRKFKFQAAQKSFKLSFDQFRSKKNLKRLSVGQSPKKVPARLGTHEIIFESIWVSRQTQKHFKAQVDFFHTQGFSKKANYYYRLVFKMKRKLDFHFQIEQVIYNSDIYESCRNATKAVINGDELVAYTFADENTENQFFAIESEIKQDFLSFSEKVFALKNAIGYLTGHLIGDSGYFFAYTRKQMVEFKHFYFCSFRNTIKSGYSPIYSNAYGYLHHKGSIAERYQKSQKLTVIPLNVLSTLSQKIHDSPEFTSALILILESSVASLLFMPGGFAIVLESLADLILRGDKVKRAPIKDRTQAKKVRATLLAVIENECKNLDDFDFKTLKNRIENINSMTNSARLRAPFDKLEIILNEEDLRILETRNDFLHGRIPNFSGYGSDDSDQRKNKDLYYASMRFYTLLNMLVLRWVGFEGYVLNFPKIYEANCGVKLKEEYFRI